MLFTGSPRRSTTSPFAQLAAIRPAGDLIWHDEFDGPANTAPNPSNWGYQVGRYNAASGELEYYTTALTNTCLDGNSNLVITARQENPPDNAAAPKNYTSGRPVTRLFQGFAPTSTTGIRVAGRIKTPGNVGINPAFWMQGMIPGNPEAWPLQGEIDIMEAPQKYTGVTRQLLPTTIHTPTAGASGHGSPDVSLGQNYFHTDNLTLDFHTYGVDWYIDKLIFWLDGRIIHTVTQAQIVAAGGDWTPMSGAYQDYILLNVSVGGSYSGNPDGTSTWPQSMLVDWVRVWQLPAGF